jgi:hypothetical protein
LRSPPGGCRVGIGDDLLNIAFAPCRSIEEKGGCNSGDGCGCDVFRMRLSNLLDADRICTGFFYSTDVGKQSGALDDKPGLVDRLRLIAVNRCREKLKRFFRAPLFNQRCCRCNRRGGTA